MGFPWATACNSVRKHLVQHLRMAKGRKRYHFQRVGESWLCLADCGTTTLLCSRQTSSYKFHKTAARHKRYKSTVLDSNSVVIATGGRVADCLLLQDL